MAPDAMTYRFVDHTADLAVELASPTLEGLFAEAVAAFTDAVVDRERVLERERRERSVAAADLERLLVSWLEEVLIAFEVDAFLVRRAEVAIAEAEGGGRTLRGALFGQPLDASRHPVKVLIKGISYHGLRVEPGPEGWRATVVFDI
jgi:SHS2 domain-containing protein